MGRVKPCRDGKEYEKSIRLAKRDFINGIEPSIHSAACTYSISYTTLLAYMDGKSVLKQIEGFIYLVYRKRKL